MSDGEDSDEEEGSNAAPSARAWRVGSRATFHRMSDAASDAEDCAPGASSGQTERRCRSSFEGSFEICDALTRASQLNLLGSRGAPSAQDFDLNTDSGGERRRPSVSSSRPSINAAYEALSAQSSRHLEDPFVTSEASNASEVRPSFLRGPYHEAKTIGLKEADMGLPIPTPSSANQAIGSEVQATVAPKEVAEESF